MQHLIPESSVDAIQVGDWKAILQPVIWQVAPDAYRPGVLNRKAGVIGFAVPFAMSMPTAFAAAERLTAR